MKTELQSRKISFIEEFLKIENEDAITRLEKLLKLKGGVELKFCISYKKERHPFAYALRFV